MKPDNSLKLYWIINPVFALLMLVWCAAYGYANYQFDECSRAVGKLSVSNQARMTAVQERLARDDVRNANVQVPIDIAAKKFN
jgi:hypothetical protein